ncbi:MAG: peptidoglycan synthetase, partial [Hymenobacteraceae bacterium]|nr:peptidoglycan synthetase [Hymenobacteraceae bacterium]MDX5395603.1 peptidoglycan synthetase [Hymenobacteraceae bacterium]MDX5511657.1 peptidoglycan synthetase [Hymenobacteraceae bacterium]
PMLEPEQLKNAFNRPDLMVITDSTELEQKLQQQNWQNRNLLLMSSGNYNNINLNELAQSLT